MGSQMFVRTQQIALSAIVFLIAMVSGSDLAAATSVLLAFSSDHCGHCRVMQPTLRQLEDERVPLRRINIDREPELARRHGIRQVPTYVVLSAGREVTRLVGAQEIETLRDALSVEQAGTQLHTGSMLDPRSVFNASATRKQSARDAVGESMPSLQRADGIQRARAATVRLRVHEGRGFGVGTGTVIDRHGDEALVLTCGHLFRETKLQARIEVDLFVAGQIRTVPGQVIDYDAGDRDIALVVIEPGFDIQPVQIRDIHQEPLTGQSAFSFGCDHGDDPSRRDTRVTAIDKYNPQINASNIEIDGAPVDGRSGGGLFDEQGRLFGVCNAADYKSNLGIYTGPRSIQWQLDRVQLSHLYQSRAQLAQQADHSLNAPQTRLASLSQPSAAMTVIIDDPQSPGGKRVMKIQQPSAELIEMLQRQTK